MTASAPKRRSRLFIGLIIVVVVLAGIVWLVVWQPLQRDLTRLQKEVQQNSVRLLVAQQQAEQIGSGKDGAVPRPNTDAKATLETTLGKDALRPSIAAMEALSPDRVRITFEAVDFDALRIHARHHMLDRAILAGRIQRLQDDHHRVLFVGPKYILQFRQLGNVFEQFVARLRLVLNAAGEARIVILQLDRTARINLPYICHIIPP